MFSVITIKISFSFIIRKRAKTFDLYGTVAFVGDIPTIVPSSYVDVAGISSLSDRDVFLASLFHSF